MNMRRIEIFLKTPKATGLCRILLFVVPLCGSERSWRHIITEPSSVAGFFKEEWSGSSRSERHK